MCVMSIPEDEAARSPSSKHSMNQRTAGSGSRHDPKFHLHSSGPFLQVGRVGPVVLHRNWREQVVLTGGTNAPRAVHADRQSSMVVPPVPPFGTTKSLRIGCSTTGTPGPTRYHGCPVLGCKSVFRKSWSFGVGCPQYFSRSLLICWGALGLRHRARFRPAGADRLEGHHRRLQSQPRPDAPCLPC